ncbi:MAG: DUF1565 domain-containing protein, partial [Planctomycetes bacterium]|nr:DUF1565 domain-containing protein [Planctomycetota bacterium]
VVGLVWSLAAVGTVPALAKTVYVSKTGNNTNNGLTWETAKLTVQEGLNTAAADDQVWVAAGTYVENITLKQGVALYGGFTGNETDLSQRDWLTNKSILDGNQAGSVVTSPSGATTTTRIDGFAIRNGSGTRVSSYRYGGGIYCSFSSPTIANNTITENTASGTSACGGGLYCSNSSPVISNNTITANTASDSNGPSGSSGYGGGIYCVGASPTISNNTINGNIAGYGGGGIHCKSYTGVIAYNTVSSNIAGMNGGGIYCGANAAAMIANNRISSNSAVYGGGIYCYFSSPTIANNTVTANSGSYGGGIYCHSSSATIVNTIVAFNSSGIYTDGTGTLTLRYNCLFGNPAYNYSGVTDPTGTNGNTSTDPKLAGVAYGNVHIQPDSPCIDVGNDTAVQPGWLDIDGQPRVIGSHVDIGADESAGTAWPPGPYVIVRVSPNGNDMNDGSSWPAAKRTVQAGIDAAVSGGGEVWVQAGTYHERVSLPPHVYLYGGFAGVETGKDERDWNVNATILDAQRSGSVVTIRGSYRAGVIDGFTIRNGTASRGGGICCEFSSPLIANNTVTENTASGTSAHGGGIYCRVSSPTIANNVISRNSGSADSSSSSCLGGGICCSGGSPTIAKNTIMENTTSGTYAYGGGIYCSDGSPTIANNTIQGNATSGTKACGGGIYCNGSPMIVNNTITGNSGSAGGGIYSGSSSTTVANTIVAFNTSGIYTNGTGALTLRYNCVFGNPAYDYSGVTDPTGSNGNISTDPKLAGVAYGNLHIEPDSPCKDAGDDAVVQAGWVDIDDQMRIQGTHVDIGADESDGTVWATGPYVTVRVSPEGDDIRDGSSWLLAKRTVQAGIDAAALLGGEVWVRAGTYPERITLSPYAHVYGGFAGTENTRGERNWVTQPTILDGQQGGSVVTAKAGFRLSTIDGFTIRNGTATYPRVEGGGIYCSGGSPTITNNTITGNGASSGGGICCSTASFPIIINNTITGNSAGSGGGIFLYGAPAVIANNIVAFNSSGVYQKNPGTPVLRSNCVYGNTSYNYSGLTDPTGTDGNMSADPKLAGVAFGNMHIQPDSPCKDAGDDAVVHADWLDIDGQARIHGSHVDIGADESDGTVWPAGPYVIVRVNPEGDDSHDGSSWLLAKRTVQAGIDAAVLLGGEVWVEAGTYGERITLLPYAHVYGGFAGTENARGERDWVTQPTILDGQQGGPVVTAKAGCLSTIDGFTIRSGTGGGINCSAGSPTIANNTITENTGGGIGCGSCSPTIANNSIINNTAQYGCAGIACWFSSPRIENNTIVGNTSLGGDNPTGGIDCYRSSAIIVNNTISHNSSPHTGGVRCSGPYSSIIGNNTIINNTGHGIACTDVGSIIVNNTILGNSRNGIYSASTSLVISNTIVAFNASGIAISSDSMLRNNCVFGNRTYNYNGTSDPTGTDGNISLDPLFVRPASPGADGQWGTADDDYGDLRLLAGSPCIDAGDNGAVPADISDLDGDGDVAEPIPFDLAGMARFIDDLLTPDTGLGTPPIVDMGAYEYAPVTLQSSNPAAGRSLWRNRRNIIRLTFDADTTAPDAGAVMIQEMIAGGTYGEDLSAGFTFTVENDGQGQPRVLKIRETASSLQHRKWYAVRNTGGWTGVAPFTVQYVVQVGDANNDGRVLNTDFGWVNAAIPTFSTADDDRRDINGDGRILNTDFGVLNSKIPSFHVAKPDGH